MPLSPGDKLGPYEILSVIGAGGMGEVYKARDTRLDRTVAIKVLPEHIAKREDLRARFEREARAVASLNHLHICTLHDIGPGYMVMEQIEGETLAARIEKGAIPLEQALKHATQIADALDRALRAGVTHRDVKPQNIMLTRDGVKVLDFGLAKSSHKPAPTESALTAALTAEGAVMGTPQYIVGAVRRQRGRRAQRHLGLWRSALRNGDGPEGVSGQELCGPGSRDSVGRSGADGGEAVYAGLARAAGAALPGEGSRGPLANDARCGD